MRPFGKFFFFKRANLVTVTLSNQTLTDYEIDPADATVDLTFNSNGTVTTDGNGASHPPRWLNGSSDGSGYEIRVTPTSGTFSSGTVNTWLSLASNRNWSVVRTTFGTKSCTATVEIRNAGSLEVLATATYTLSATVDL
jgi:hypothetical protein